VVSPEPNAELTRLSAEFFEVQHSTDPFSATLLGVSGFDSEVPDPSRAGAQANAARIASIEARLAQIDVDSLHDSDRVNHAVLGGLAWGARSDLEHGLWEANASAASYASPQAMVFQSVPTAPLRDAAAVDGYLRRLGHLGWYLDAIAERYARAKDDGRVPTAVGVVHAMEQLAGHLALSPAEDTLLSPALPADVDTDKVRSQAARIVAEEVRPAMRRLRSRLQDELLPVARPDDRVGIRFVPGGEEGYRAAVRRHTTTGLSAEEIHQTGRDYLDALGVEWAEVGGRALGTTDVAEIRRRLREDPTLRFTDRAGVVAMVDGALRRAEEVRDDWFPAYDLPSCVIEEINPIEAGNAPLAYYRPPAGDGSRPGAHCVLTANPQDRFSYEYEALAFHESVPGHHLQIASAQALTGLPAYRRFLDAEVCGYIEGWGLYSERLADEMGLYTSDVQRLGMLSFDALRACRLVVDTGMHHLGWSRQQAVDFMWRNTATTKANVDSEIDRYIAWPGQALAYLVGRREISRLRTVAEQRLGPRFDLRAFHGTVLGNGAVPLGVLEQIVMRWIERDAA
jgi:uncharacterized protein (DUF885 family)